MSLVINVKSASDSTRLAMICSVSLLARLHIVYEDQTSDACWRLSLSVVVCYTPRQHICNVTHQEAAHNGGPVVVLLVRVTPYFVSNAIKDNE